jgi:hypothetical protein
LLDEDRCDDFCGYSTDFARINFGVSSLSKEQLGALMLGRLKAALAKYKIYRNAATGTTRDFYDYEIMKIEKVLSNK